MRDFYNVHIVHNIHKVHNDHYVHIVHNEPLLSSSLLSQSTTLLNFHTCLFLLYQLDCRSVSAMVTGWHQDHGPALQPKAMVKITKETSFPFLQALNSGISI